MSLKNKITEKLIKLNEANVVVGDEDYDKIKNKLNKDDIVKIVDEGEETDENSPWAICTASVGREDKDKFESCIKKVKQQNESVNAKLTKAELIRLVEEANKPEVVKTVKKNNI